MNHAPVLTFDLAVYTKDILLFTSPVGQYDRATAPTVATIEYIRAFDDLIRAHVSPHNVSFDALGAGLNNPAILAWALEDIRHPTDIVMLVDQSTPQCHESVFHHYYHNNHGMY